ncbi:hypothetical protein SAMN05880582_1076 [Rhizobium sp. RU20A]|uniref:PilZ domain-containing protein n=1 Tax=Rhizobium sp. RU20A TaxID=1907412 RepID=UPI00095639D8|nr:PilZ domain-containing protein [Rhizobium sp. RU20A]SIR14458.1 hypothetical protein SAMN05880582_1076 [Rhizobium sp. RU20A]
MLMHVAQGRPGETSTRYKHFPIERPCRILIIGQHLKPKQKYQALLREISIGGALLDCNPGLQLPKQFFLQVDGFNDEMGCSQVYRKGAALGIRFNMLISQEFISRLIRLQFASGCL